jgi:hypothetical protein
MRNFMAAIRSFTEWFFHPDEDKETYWIAETVRYAADLYTRADHTGTCIPKTVLFAYYKGVQFSSGDPVASWPEGEVRSGFPEPPPGTSSSLRSGKRKHESG